MFKLTKKILRQSAQSPNRSKRDKESEKAKGGERDGGTKARTKVKNPGEEKIVSSEQTNEERLSTVTSQHQGQQREEVDAAHNFNSCDVTEKTNKKLRGDLTAIQKRLDDVEKFMFGLGSNKCPMRLNEVGKLDAKTEQDLLETISKLKEAVERISFENETLLDKMREVTEQRRNEEKNNEAIKTLNEAVRTFKTDNFIDKISELQEQHQNEKKGNQETIKKLNEAVERISSENKKCLVKMAELEEKHHNEKKENEENINRLCEAIEIIALDNEKLNVKIKDLTKQRHNETNEGQEHIDTMGEAADRISFTNERRHVNMAEKNCRKVKYNDDIVNRLNRLNQAVDRISHDYKQLKEEIGLFRHRFQDGDIAVAKPDEAVEHLNARGHRKLEKKQDRESSDQLDSQDTESIEDDSDWDEDAVNDDEPMRTMYMPLSNEPSVYTTEGVNPQSPQVLIVPLLGDFKPLKLLGSGGYGHIHLVQKKNGKDRGKLYAMKTMNTSQIFSANNGLERHNTECYIHQKVADHPFLVGMYYRFQTELKVCLMLDYYPGGDMYHVLLEQGVFRESAARLYLAEIVLGVEHLHQLGIIHRDLKPDNILIDSEGHIAITDFGLTKSFLSYTKKNRAYSWCGTPSYMAPEMIDSETGYGIEVDWWGVGLICYEMLSGCSAFEPGDEKGFKKLFEQITSVSPVIPDWLSAEAGHFISSLLEKNPSERLGTGKNGSQNIKQHPFFSGINWNNVSRKLLTMPRLPSCVNESQSVDKDLRMECIVHLYASGNNTEICTYIAPGLIPIQTHGTETSY